MLTALILVAESPPNSFATTCADICPGSGACTIGSDITADPDSVIDCSGRDITIGNAGELKAIDGDLTLIADDLTLNGPYGVIYVAEGSNEIMGSLDIILTGNLSLSGKIRANGPNGAGTINIEVVGNIVIPENGNDGIEATGNAAYSDGGEITISAGGTIEIYDPIHAEGADSGETVGGVVTIRAVGDITTDTNGHLSVPGKAEGGGQVSIISEEGDVTISEHIEVDGKGATGDGGSIFISAGDTLTISEELYARGGINQQGGEASGGHVELEAGCGGIVVNSSILATGGQLGTGEDGGSIEAQSEGSITIAAGVTLDSHARASGGDGGMVELSARDLVSLAGTSTIDARGSTTSPGRGGLVRLAGCKVSVASGATIDTTGAKGGSIVTSATLDPPSTGTQPLLVTQGAVLKALGATNADNGSILLTPLTSKLGQCSNDGQIECQYDGDCTVGCSTGDCLYANPDTQGVATQFDVATSIFADASLGQCRSACGE